MIKTSSKREEPGANHLVEAARRQFEKHPTLRTVRSIVVLVVGGTVFLIGCALLVLPGPAIVVIPAGLAILGLEFRWARRWLRRARNLIDQARGG